MLNSQFVLCELVQQGQGEVCLLQHAQDFAGAKSERVANLRECFA